MGGFCLLVELHRWRVCVCSLRSRLVYIYIYIKYTEEEVRVRPRKGEGRTSWDQLSKYWDYTGEISVVFISCDFFVLAWFQEKDFFLKLKIYEERQKWDPWYYGTLSSHLNTHKVFCHLENWIGETFSVLAIVLKAVVVVVDVVVMVVVLVVDSWSWLWVVM